MNITIKDVVLTPLTCASLINDTLKCLIYEKSQIPFPYNWLKSIVTRKRKTCENGSDYSFGSYAAERYFRVASVAYDALEEIMKNIVEEFKKHKENIEEVLVLFGSTPHCPKEAFSIRISNLARGHIENNHLFVNSKNQYKIMREVLLSNEWICAMQTSVPATNMYVMIKKRTKPLCQVENGVCDDFFLPQRDYSLPAKLKKTVITLEYDNSDIPNCCSNFSIFEDLQDNVEHKENIHNNTNEVSNISSEDFLWCESKVFLKGFKDCIINKKSASELWFDLEK